DEPPERDGPRDGTRQEDRPPAADRQNGPATPERRPGAVLREASAPGLSGARPSPVPLEDTGRVRMLPPAPEPVAWRIILQRLHPGTRSEERRVGKECTPRWAQEHRPPAYNRHQPS